MPKMLYLQKKINEHGEKHNIIKAQDVQPIAQMEEGTKR